MIGAPSIADFLQRSLKTPKTQLGILLAVLFGTSLIRQPSIALLTTLFIANAATVTSDLLFLKLRKTPLFFPSAALVAGTIIALVLSPQPSWHHLVAGVLAMASKHFLRFPRHIFNPAAFGLFASALFFASPISWWGVSFQQFQISNLKSQIFFLILLSPVLISSYRLRRYPMILSFLITYTLLNQLFTFHFSLFTSFFDPTILFFSLVMLPEPMTSPARPHRQLLYGALVALVFSFLSIPIFDSQFSVFNWLPDGLLAALLIGNLAFFRFR